MANVLKPLQLQRFRKDNSNAFALIRNNRATPPQITPLLKVRRKAFNYMENHRRGMNRFADQTPPDRRNSVRSDTVRVLVAVSETASSELFEPSLRAAEGSQRTTPLATSPPPAPSPSGPRMNSERGCVSSQKRPLGRPKIAPEIPLPANAQDDLTPFWGSRSAPRQFRGGRRKRSGRNPADRTFALSRRFNQIASTRGIPSRPIAALGHRGIPVEAPKSGSGEVSGPALSPSPQPT